MKQIDRNSKIPLHLQLADILRQKMKDGAIQPGDKLMSETEMVKHYDVARLTVREALNHLVNEGLIEKQHGRGSFCKNISSRRNIDVLLDMNEHYFVPYYMQSISSVLESHNANLIAGDTKNSNAEIVRKLETIALRGSDGVILQGCPSLDVDKTTLAAALGKLAQLQIPIIIIDYDYEIDEVHYAVMDEIKVGHLAAEHFKHCGHKKTAAVCVPNDGLSEKRYAGFCCEMNSCLRINTGNDLQNELINAIRSGVTGLFCYNDSLALQCIGLLQEHGYSLPDDISVISVDDTILAKFNNMTSVAHPKHILGEYAAKEILGTTPPKSKVFTPSITLRSSVKNIT